MFERLRARWFFSKVAAELKGQVREQRVVNGLLERPAAIRAIEDVRKNDNYVFVAGPRLLPYLGACEALAAIMDDASLPGNERLMAAGFLFTRLDRAGGLSGPIIEDIKARYRTFMTTAA